ncbi:MAG: hypothetical protein ACI4S4_06210 [Candidatus Ornithospirochaeta sp.]
MEKARQFLDIYIGSSDYTERLLSLYNGLFLLLGDEIWKKIGKEGIERERMEDALRYTREDSEESGKTVLAEEEMEKLRILLESLMP